MVAELSDSQSVWVDLPMSRDARSAGGARTRCRASQSRSGCATDVCLLERVRDSVEGRELIDWADTDFESLQRDLHVIRLSDVSRMSDHSIYATSLPDMVRFHAQRRTSHVLVTSLNENWGAFSSHIPNRTYPQGDWDARVIEAGCSPEAVQTYLDDPAVKAVVTLQHTAFDHPAILSIPIGIHHPKAIRDHLGDADGAKTQDLLINNNAWRGGSRERINDRVIANFGGRLRNTYGLPLTDYYQSIMRSKFVLCPSGMGLDTHRLWETLILGSIPIVERCAGWQRVLDDLPAVWVTDFAEVTPDALARAYEDIHARCDRFDFAKLTRQWWTTRIQGLVADTITSEGTCDTALIPHECQHRIEACAGGHAYLGRVTRRRVAAPATSPGIAFDPDRDVLEPLLRFMSERGRPPPLGELDEGDSLEEGIGSVDEAITLLARAEKVRSQEEATATGQRDLLVYIALAILCRHPTFSALPRDLQNDIRLLLGSCAAATQRGRELLFSAGQQRALSEDCARSPVGRLLPDALYVHVSSIADLPVLLRGYEGCARALLGAVPGATLVKLRRDTPRIAYLCYRDFDEDPHPQLREKFVADLASLRIYHRGGIQTNDPPLLHRKECFVSDSYPRRAEFAALTLAEVEAGLLSDPAEVGTARAWKQRLAAAGLTIVGHELVKCDWGHI